MVHFTFAFSYTLIVALLLSLFASVVSATTATTTTGKSLLLSQHQRGFPFGRRQLQEGGDGGLCIDDGSGSVGVAFDDAFREAAFDRSLYDSSCNCTDAGLDELSSLATNSFDGEDASLAALNKAISELQGNQEFGCVNKCEFCYQKMTATDTVVCGLLETSEQRLFEGSPGTNLTLQDVQSESFFDLLSAQQLYNVCITFTKGYTGQVCFSGSASTGAAFVANGTQVNNDGVQRNCSVSYNGVACNSCILDAQTDSDEVCRIADCSNLLEDGADVMINTCEGTGTSGLFEIVQLFTDVNSTDGFSAGQCGDAIVLVSGTDGNISIGTPTSSTPPAAAAPSSGATTAPAPNPAPSSNAATPTTSGTGRQRQQQVMTAACVSMLATTTLSMSVLFAQWW